jgi:hypothetical protein
MKLIMFIKSLFKPSQERLAKIKEMEMRRVLIRMAERYYEDGDGILLLRATDARQELASSGFIQVLDGGNKDSSVSAHWCVISSNGLNHLGYPGR